MSSITINQKTLLAAKSSLAVSLTPKIREAREVARATAPVDTSSLQESIRSEVAVTSAAIVIDLIAGGVDYSGQIMSSTGELGNVVDYAAEQEAIHGFLAHAQATLVSGLS